MQVKLDFATKNVKKNNMKNFLKISIDVSDERKKKNTTSRKPVFLIPVIDCSGSMSTPSAIVENQNIITSLSHTSYWSTSCAYTGPSKLECAKNATMHLLDLLKEEDKIAVVSFDDKVYINQNPIEINHKNKLEIQHNIQKINAGGCTNISGALKTAFDLFTREDMQKYNCKIVLLSDGQANVGFDTPKQFVPLLSKIVEKKITVSTVGLGIDYDLNLMEAISSEGAGSFNHISDALLIKDIFASELRTTQDIVCKDMTVKLMLPDMVAFKPNLNNYSETILQDSICLKLGNIYTNKEIYYEFDILSDKAATLNIEVVVEYEDRKENKSAISIKKEMHIVNEDEDAGENQEIIDAIVNMVKDRYIYNATKATSENDIASASAFYAQSKTMLDNMAVAYNCCSTISATSQELDSVSNAIRQSSEDDIRDMFTQTTKRLRNTE